MKKPLNLLLNPLLVGAAFVALTACSGGGRAGDPPYVGLWDDDHPAYVGGAYEGRWDEDLGKTPSPVPVQAAEPASALLAATALVTLAGLYEVNHRKSK